MAKAYDRNCTPEKSLRFEVQTDEVFTLSSISILATGLLFIWENRKQIKKTTLYMMRAQLEAVVSIRRLKKIREAGDIMYKLMNNMVIVNRVQNLRAVAVTGEIYLHQHMGLGRAEQNCTLCQLFVLDLPFSWMRM